MRLKASQRKTNKAIWNLQAFAEDRVIGNETITVKHSEALVATSNGAEYIRGLCSHWASHFPVQYTEATGQIVLPQTICRLVAAPSTLLLQLEVQADADRQQMEDVVEQHLRRVARDEEINLKWRPR
jgi:hypothetical protein